ncbi:MAG: hypothetical protein FWE67_00560 [Planctomycetaceae bacterium]|nr:hypothetical protein [Planctomycetaceae bacterium]
MLNRRGFLKFLALLSAVAVLPIYNLFAESPLTPKPVGDGFTVIRHTEEIRGQKAPPRKIIIPDADGFKVLKGDFHMHTLFSDGRVMPVDRVNEAVNNGLDVIAITDHIESQNKELTNGADRNRPYELAKAEAAKNKLILVRGGEMATSEWHFNLLFLQDVNPIAEIPRNEWQKRLALSAEQGGFNHWNHPSWLDTTPDTPPFGLKKGEPMRFFDEIEEVRKKGHIHGVEVFNGVSFFPIALDWCNERDLVPVANSDIHASEWNTYGYQNLQRPMTLIFAKDRSHDSVKEAFFAKRTVGWAANMILGRQPWVEKLFRACVEIKKEGNGVTLNNTSDIPCLIEADGKTFDLLPQGSVEIGAAKKLTVSNWFVGMKKPLEIEL